jgi:maleylpyruvate isomerase
MARTVQQTRRWASQGTTVFLQAIDRLSEGQWSANSALPGWTRRHLVAHLAANADALANLVHWAVTGEETPMYASAEARAAAIERGAGLGAGELTRWAHQSATTLEDALAQVTPDQWYHQVRTAQGRSVAATEIPWLRAREVWVHAVDLGPDAPGPVSFADLPADFLHALIGDICAQRGLDTTTLPDAPLPDIAAWLAGRSHHLTHVADLGPWL